MSVKPLKKEIDRVAALLMEGDESPQALADKVIRALDEVRGERTTYGVVLRIGEGKRAFFVGYHGFSTRNQAIKSVEKNPQAAMASGIAVVAMKNEAGLDQLIARVDAPPAPTGDWPEIYADVAAARAKRRGR